MSLNGNPLPSWEVTITKIYSNPLKLTTVLTFLPYATSDASDTTSLKKRSTKKPQNATDVENKVLIIHESASAYTTRTQPSTLEWRVYHCRFHWDSTIPIDARKLGLDHKHNLFSLHRATVRSYKLKTWYHKNFKPSLYCLSNIPAISQATHHTKKMYGHLYLIFGEMVKIQKRQKRCTSKFRISVSSSSGDLLLP